MTRSFLCVALSATSIFTLSAPAFAHMTLEVPEASIGGSYKAVIRVPHGCGAAATTSIHVTIPEGFHSVKPMPHAGWQLETVSGAYANTYMNHGRSVSEGVKEVVWSGGNLPDAFYDEFILRGTFGDTFNDSDTVYFPAIQTCENGETNEWVGTAADKDKDPAPKLTLHAAQTANEHAGHNMAMHNAVVTLGDLEISNGFARATLPKAPVGGGFVTIVNKGAEDDTLVSAVSDVAGEVQLHNMRVENDVMKMYEMEGGIPIPAGETVTLAPGGLHIMFMQLKQQLAEGSKVKVTLTFEKAGSIDVMLDVRSVGAKGSMNHEGMSHGS